MIRNWLLKLLGFGKTLVAFLIPIVAKHTATMIDAALPLAQNIVKSYESTGLDADQKRTMAVSQLRDALVAQGHAAASDLATSTLNWLVETALQKIRAAAPPPS